MVFGELVEIACTDDFLVDDGVLLLVFRVVVAGFLAAFFKGIASRKLHQLVVSKKNPKLQVVK